MYRVHQRVMSRMLTQEPCGDHMRIVGELIGAANNDLGLLWKVVTTNKTWSCLYDPHSK
jgi:hypothetical protein